MSDTASHDYQVGQIWAYHTRQGEEHSRLLITQIDHFEGHDTIFHLYIDQLEMKGPHTNASAPINSELPHVPVTQSTLDESVTKLIGTASDLPDNSEGYTIWRTAFDDHKAGVFDLPLKDIVRCLEEVLQAH